MSRQLENLGLALRLLRSRRYLKQTEVSDKSGLTKAMLSSYETGKSIPSLPSLDAILVALGADFSELQDALSAVSGAKTPNRTPSATEALRVTALSELPKVLRELQIPLERVAASIERLCGTLDAGGGTEDGRTSP